MILNRKTMNVLFVLWIYFAGLLPFIYAQNDNNYHIKAKPLIMFNWSCTHPNNVRKSQLIKFNSSVIDQIEDKSIQWGDRAFTFDLNNDDRSEYFVPLNCGVTSNCSWGIFSDSAPHLLGIINAEFIFIHKPISKWSDITVYIHSGASYSFIETFSFKKTKYVKNPGSYLASAEKNDFPKLLDNLHPVCDPDYYEKRRK
jgi:hypothetical protein